MRGHRMFGGKEEMRGWEKERRVRRLTDSLFQKEKQYFPIHRVTYAVDGLNTTIPCVSTHRATNAVDSLNTTIPCVSTYS